MTRLLLIFVAFIINSAITFYLTDIGTMMNNLLKSMSISMIIVFLFYYTKLMMEIKGE
ncbi:hypothetical protein MUA90_02640 [Staphylococcus sp. IVB6181]|uniref:hypothetical protein n=1 Tax=Staphylococcus sp. EZ-P03 TaxID=2282739 RepID=UPI001E38CEEC|nr:MULTISPECIES: hypothetical protein [Staphylococcus]UXV36170.1 hypothetical protein MUA90_02640 [Staphylococcus sp. IVB6181]